MFFQNRLIYKNKKGLTVSAQVECQIYNKAILPNEVQDKLISLPHQSGRSPLLYNRLHIKLPLGNLVKSIKYADLNDENAIFLTKFKSSCYKTIHD